MNSIEDEVNRAVENLVAQLVDLGYRAARERLQSIGRSIASGSGNAGSPRRDPADLASLSARFMAHVQAHPGLHLEEINEELGTTRKDLRLPIRRLLADGRLVTRGQSRRTTYYPSPSAGESVEHPAPPAHQCSTVTSPPPSALDATSGDTGGTGDLCNLASLSSLYSDTELDPGLGRLLADVLALSRKLRE